MSWNEDGGAPPPEADTTRWSGLDAVNFAWAHVKARFFPIVGPLFVAQLVGMLPVLGLMSFQSARVFEAIQAKRVPDPNDPVLLEMQVVSTVLTWVAFGFVNGGLYRFALAVLRGQPTSFGDVFSGGRWFGASTTALVLAGLAYLPGSFVPLLIRVAGLPPTLQLPIQLVLVVPGLLLWLGWSMAFPLIVDRGLGGVAAMKESWRITAGRRVDIFVAVLLLFCMGFAGCCLCGLGLPIAMAVSPITLSFIYLRLTGQPVVSAAS